MPPKVLILRTAGTNGDRELAVAFEMAGAVAEAVHLHRLIGEPELLGGFQILGLPGGFSYGDDISAGRILANRIRHRLLGALQELIAAGKPVIGICNGFQVLLKAGLLPGVAGPGAGPAQTLTLADNTFPRFVDRWCGLRAEAQSPCIWTRGLDTLELPIAHGEGRLIGHHDVLDRLEAGGQVPVRYMENPNGSLRDIAGVCDPTGLVLGLMPHPERSAVATHHPAWTPEALDGDRPPAGLRMLMNAVEYVGGQVPCHTSKGARARNDP